MQHVTRFTLIFLLVVTLSAASGAKTDPKQSEYTRSDTNYYFKSDVLKADPGAVIIESGKYTQKGDSYFITPKIRAPKEIYIQVENDWLEPITPPTMPTSLGVAPDAMQIREPQGDVQVALPTAPAAFAPAQDNQIIPNGAVVKTGANGSAAILLGGVDSVRLIPNSSAAIQQTVTALLRTTEVDLTVGAAFSKVGKRIGEKQDYQVHTPFGVAAARGTDFVTIALPARTDVWIAQGTVQLNQPDGKVVGTVSSEGTGALKIIRYPAMPDAQQSMMASAQTMTTAFDFIPTVNVYVKALHDKMAQGLKLTPTERDYLNRIKKVPCLIKLALVEPPPPPAPPPPPPPPPKPAPLVPMNLDLRTDGKVDFQGATLTLDELTPKLEDIAKTTPLQPLIVTGREKVTHAQLKKVVAACHSAKLTKVTVAKAAPLPPPAPMPSTGSGPTIAPLPAPETQAAVPPQQPIAMLNSPTTPPTPAPTPAPKAVPMPPPAPIDVAVRADGKVDFQDATLSLEDFKTKLQEIAKATPNQPLVVKKKEKLEKGQLKKVVSICHAAKLKTTIDKTEPPAAPPAVAAPASIPAPAPAPEPPPKQLPPAMLLPLNLDLRPDGKVDVQGATYTLDELKSKLAEIAKATPHQPLIVNGREKVTHSELKKVVAICHAAKLTKVTIAKAAPTATPAVANGASPKSQPPSSAAAGQAASVTSLASTNASPASPDSTSSLASLATTNAITNEPTVTKPKTKSHTTTLTAPISTGPNYTVP